MRTHNRGHRRPFVAVGLVALLALSGCSVAKGFGAGGNGVPSSALCPGKKAAAHVTVVHYWQVFAAPASLKSAQAFNCDHPDIAVDISPVPQVGDDNDGKLLATTSAKKPPDAVLSFDDVINAWAARGELQPLDAFAADHGIKQQDYIDQAWKSTLWHGKQYGIPADWDPDTLLWWNKKLFTAAGLDPDKPPTTWAQVQSYAAKLDKVQGGRIQQLGFVPWTGWQFGYLQIAQQWNADLADGSSPDSVVVDSPGMRKAFDYLHQVATRYGGSAAVNSFTTATGANGTTVDPLTSGRVGMLLIGDWQMGQQAIIGTKKFRETVGVAAMPPPPGGRNYLCHSGWSFMIPTGAKHPKEAMEFITWMQQPQHFAKYLGETIGWLSARKETRSQGYVANDPTWQKILQVEQQQGYGWWLPPSPIIQQYYRILDQQMSAVTALQKKPDAGVLDAQTQVEAALTNAKAIGVYSTGS